jgi:hypothetical protein
MATSLREALTAIYTDRGQLTPPIVVEEASNPQHPLHSRFEWDDAIAGPKYRERQAADMIRSVRVRFTSPNSQEEIDVRAFVSRREAGDMHAVAAEYAPVEEIMLDDVARTILLRNMEREWQAFRRRYQHLKEFADLMLRETLDQTS